jgi:outer membrane protein OmpA-like peptidoglycan-associated protein
MDAFERVTMISSTPNMPRSPLARFAAAGVAMLLVGLGGCISSGKVADETKRITEIIRAAKLQAYYCAAKDLALAEAHLELANVESKRGDTIAAYEHIERAKRHSAKVYAVKDKKGCCPDGDGDGLCDAEDKCPGDAEDMDGDEDTDGCPESDRDDDGIHDQRDRCPDEAEDKDGFLDEDGFPEDKDGYADADGCPDFDNDGDGILDFPQRNDKCANKPEVYNGIDDLDGCPDKKAAPPKPKEYKNIIVEKDRIVFKKQIRFKTGSAKIIGDLSFQILDEAADALRSRTDVRVQVEGHTDKCGSSRSNKLLSQQRAESVVAAMVERGLARSRLLPVGFGQCSPISEYRDSTKEALAKNRRVEFNFIIADGQSDTLRDRQPDAECLRETRKQKITKCRKTRSKKRRRRTRSKRRRK